jgi:hypothetical protein
MRRSCPSSAVSPNALSAARTYSFPRVTFTSTESNRLTISTAQLCVTFRARISTSENSLVDSPGAEVGLDYR